MCDEYGELLPNTFLLPLTSYNDLRGSFIKIHRANIDYVLSSPFLLKEEFYTISKKNVIRGMHFQIPPFEHTKLVYCISGSAVDVVLDMRKGPGYGKFKVINFSEKTPKLLVVPRGVAHGFLALQKNTIMVYKVDSEYSAGHDCGVRWDSFGFDWNVLRPIISDRDNSFMNFDKFNSPF